MQLKFDGNSIKILGKEPNELDKRVANFIKILNKLDYVIISGYIAILFGRSRSTEDIDLFVELRNKEDFTNFYNKVKKNNYYIINAMDKEDAYSLLIEGIPIRIAVNKEIIPNFEVKIPIKEIDKISIKNKVIVKFGKYRLNIPMLELQIAYKLFLGSEKDYLDAAHLYDLSSKYLNKDKFHSFIKMLNVNKNIVKKVLKLDKI